jgi:hypothetical protein
MKSSLIIITALLSACAQQPVAIGHQQIEREFGGIEIGQDFTPLSADVGKALNVDMKSSKSSE